MLAGWNRRHQLDIRMHAYTVWWIVATMRALTGSDNSNFTPLHVARSYPGFQYQDGEVPVPE